MVKEKYWKYSLIVFILGLGFLLFRQAQPFMNGILGGFTLYLLLRNVTFWLQTKMKPALAVWLVTIVVTLFILVPLSLFGWALVSQVSQMHFDTEAIIRPMWQVVDFIKDRTGFDVLSEKSLSFLVAQASSIGQSVMSGVSDLLVNLCVAIMLMFFMLYEGKSMEHYISTLLPFRAENKIEVLKKVQLMVRSNAIGIPLLAIIQGFISLGGYLICDAPNPFLSAMLTAFASVIPLVGTALIWGPITVYFLKPDPFPVAKEDGRRTSVDYHLWSGGRTSSVWFHGNYFWPFTGVFVSSVCGYVPERISARRWRKLILRNLGGQIMQNGFFLVRVEPGDFRISFEPSHLFPGIDS